MAQPGFLFGKNVLLRKLTADDATFEYLEWLNDPEVLRFRGQKVYPQNLVDLRQFLEGVQSARDLFLAVCLRGDGRHIGGISLSSLHFFHRTAELSLMIGDKSRWNSGLGAEAIAVLTRHAFLTMNLHKVWSESPNPAFNAVVKKLGWAHEGTKRKLFYLDGQYVDVECFGQLRPEFDVSRLARYWD